MYSHLLCIHTTLFLPPPALPYLTYFALLDTSSSLFRTHAQSSADHIVFCYLYIHTCHTIPVLSSVPIPAALTIVLILHLFLRLPSYQAFWTPSACECFYLHRCLPRILTRSFLLLIRSAYLPTRTLTAATTTAVIIIADCWRIQYASRYQPTQ